MKTIKTALMVFLIFTILTGVIYPLLITGIAMITFPEKANGSLMNNGGKITGSKLIGQNFDSLIYFTGRPSATMYDTLPSGGSNLSLTNKELVKLVIQRKNNFICVNHPDSGTRIPSEMVFASASGLDPHISPESAFLQLSRVAKERNLNMEQTEELKKVISECIEKPQFYLLGESRINVLLLNQKVDMQFSSVISNTK